MCVSVEATGVESPGVVVIGRFEQYLVDVENWKCSPLEKDHLILF